MQRIQLLAYGTKRLRELSFDREYAVRAEYKREAINFTE